MVDYLGINYTYYYKHQEQNQIFKNRTFLWEQIKHILIIELNLEKTTEQNSEAFFEKWRESEKDQKSQKLVPQFGSFVLKDPSLEIILV